MSRILIVIFIVLLVILFLAGCSGMKMDGGCTYVREVKTSYICLPDSKLEHYRVAPGGPEP